MYLVDTSVWVDYLRGSEASKAVDFLDQLLQNPIACGINHQIYLEILQGAKNEKAYLNLRKYFSGQRFYRFGDDEEAYALAAKLYLDCRKQGITIRSSIDCLIAQCAIEHELILLHRDQDFVHIQTIADNLQLKTFA